MTRNVLGWIGAVMLAAVGCAPPASNVVQRPAAQAHNLTVPARKSIRRVISQPGTIHAFEETPLFAKLPGYVSAVKVDIGDRVRGPHSTSPGNAIEPGQILAEISIPELAEEARQKAALVTQAEVGIEQAKKLVASGEANVTAVKATRKEVQAGLSRAQANYDRWESESKRVAGLVRDKVIDEQTRDETNNQFRAAEAARNEAQARVTTAEALVKKAQADRDKASADVSGADARLKVAQADAARSQAMLQYTKIRAPFDGVVTSRHVDTGHFLQPGGGKSEPLFTITRIDPVRVAVDVPEADAGEIRDTVEAGVLVPALRGAEIVGKIARNAWALQPGARTLKAEIDLPNADGTLRPGMYVYARILIVLPEAWTLPTTALLKQGDETICFRSVEGKAARMLVVVGQSDGEWTQVLKWKKAGSAEDWQDWHGNESVVANQINGLTDGQVLDIKK